MADYKFYMQRKDYDNRFYASNYSDLSELTMWTDGGTQVVAPTKSFVDGKLRLMFPNDMSFGTGLGMSCTSLILANLKSKTQYSIKIKYTTNGVGSNINNSVCLQLVKPWNEYKINENLGGTSFSTAVTPDNNGNYYLLFKKNNNNTIQNLYIDIESIEITNAVFDLETDFDGLKYVSSTGLNSLGAIKNSYTETFAESSELKTYIPENIARENTDIEFEFLFTGDSLTDTYYDFVDYISGHKVDYWDTFRKRKTTMLMTESVEPSEQMLYGNNQYMRAKFKFKNIYGQTLPFIATMLSSGYWSMSGFFDFTDTFNF